MVAQGAGMAEVRLGASVPFEGESLLGARVRADQSHGLLMVLRNFSNLDSTYILPWRDAPLSFAMNRFDQSLHSVVEEIAATTPYAVSRAVRRVKPSGVAGLPMAKLEQEKMETERLREACISSALVARLVMELEIDVDQLRGAASGSPIVRATKAKLRACSDRIGISATELIRRSEDLASLIQPAGLSQRDGPIHTAGYIRTMTNEIVGCQAFFGDCSTIAEPAVAGYYEKAFCVVSATAEMASDLLGTVDEHLAPLLTVLAEWERWRPQIQALIDNLVWLLDGWDVALDFAARNLVDVLDQETMMNKLVALFPSASAPRLGSGLVH